MSGLATRVLHAPSVFVMRLTWLDFMRRKDLYVVAIFMALFVIGTLTIRLIGIGAESTALFLMSAGLTLSHVLSAFVAASFAARCFPEEFERGTLAPLLAKPLNRFDILLGKVTACVVMAVGCYVLFVALTLVAVPFVSGQRPWALIQVVSLQIVGLVCLIAISLSISLYCPAVVSALVALTWYFCAGVVLNIVRDSVAVKHAAVLPLADRALALVPDLTLLLHTEAFANRWGVLDNSLFLHLMLYGIAWTLFFVLWANWRFSRMRP